MRHTTRALLTGLLTLWLLTSCASIQPIDTKALPLIDLGAADSEADMDQLLALVRQFEAGELAESVIHIPAGTVLPVGIFIDTPMAQMESGCSQLHVNRELWFHVNNRRLKASPDGKRWAKLDDKKRMRELFGYQAGRLSVDLKAMRATGAGLSITIQADPQE